MEILNDDELLEEIKKRFNNQKQALLELERMTNKLKDLNQKLEESERLKSHFLSNIRNEIINPFASIMGLSQNILQLGEDNIDKIHNKASMIHYEAFSLDFQLQNIFAAAEIEAGNVQPRYMSVDINQICHSVIDSFKHEFTKRKQVLNYKTHIVDTLFRTDPQKFSIIFANIISNSIKFSHKENIINVEVKIIDELLEISVQDYGVGIDNDFLKTIFDRFKRIDDTINTLNSGHGLGLSVVYAFLELLGGTIRVESSKNVGSTFIITIPNYLNTNEIDDLAIGDKDFLFGTSGEVF